MFINLELMIPSPPWALGLQTACHLTMWYFHLGPAPSQKKRARGVSIFVWTPSASKNIPMANIGKDERLELVKISLAPEDIK